MSYISAIANQYHSTSKPHEYILRRGEKQYKNVIPLRRKRESKHYKCSLIENDYKITQHSDFWETVWETQCSSPNLSSTGMGQSPMSHGSTLKLNK